MLIRPSQLFKTDKTILINRTRPRRRGSGKPRHFAAHIWRDVLRTVAEGWTKYLTIDTGIFWFCKCLMASTTGNYKAHQMF